MFKKYCMIFFMAALLKQIVWIAVIPMFHTPDEQAHFATAQNLAEKNVYGKLTSSKELEIAEKSLQVWRDRNGNNRFTYHPEYRLPASNGLIGIDEKKINAIPLAARRQFTFNEAAWYPPLYYQFAAVFYKLVYPSGLIMRLFVMRILQTIFYLLTALTYYLLAKKTITDKRLVPFFLAFIIFLPMPSFVAAGINSDNLINGLFPIVIYLCLLVIERGLSVKYFLLFLLLFFLGIRTKPQFVVALPIFFTALLARQLMQRRLREILLPAAIFSLLFAIIYRQQVGVFLHTGRIAAFFPEAGTVSFLKAQGRLSVFAYFWQTIGKTYRETLPWFWGVFRWLSLGLPSCLRRVFNLLTLFSFVSLAVYFIRAGRRKRDVYFIKTMFLAGTVAIYFLAIFFWDYLFFLRQNFSFGIQGRYYFPVLFPIVFIIFTYTVEPLQFLLFFLPRHTAARLLAIFSVMVNFYVLAIIAASYYRISSWEKFINDISQYKPVFFKGEFLVGWSMLYLFAALILIRFLLKYEQRN